MLALAQARGGFPFGVVPSHTVCIIAYSNRPSSNFVPPGEFAPDAVNAILNSYRGLPEWGGSAAAQRRELDRRKREHRIDPFAAKPWSDVRDRLQKRKKLRRG